MERIKTLSLDLETYSSIDLARNVSKHSLWI